MLCHPAKCAPEILCLVMLCLPLPRNVCNASACLMVLGSRTVQNKTVQMPTETKFGLLCFLF